MYISSDKCQQITFDLTIHKRNNLPLCMVLFCYNKIKQYIYKEKFFLNFKIMEVHTTNEYE